jgi:hypothetical protein
LFVFFERTQVLRKSDFRTVQIFKETRREKEERKQKTKDRKTSRASPDAMKHHRMARASGRGH